MSTTETARFEDASVEGAYRLLVVYSPGGRLEGVTVPITTEPVRIGRAGPSADLPLEDDRVSREHAVVAPTASGLSLRDLGSRNGTFLDGERVRETGLDDGDVLRVGSHLVLVQYVRFADALVATAAELSPREIVGPSFALARVRHQVARLAPTLAPVLVRGDSGVGKELVARAIHDAAGRAGVLVPVNCAALPDALVESELFGHVQGAYSGASTSSQGLFGRAEGGTLFLDEIGEMPPRAQAKLLRAIEAREVRRVGADHPREVDVRVVAATNVDLASAIAAGRFRGDLYARFMGHEVVLPALRERREDVLPLWRHFSSAPGVEMTADAAEALLLHDWPYNVRELRQAAAAIEAEVFERRPITLADLPERLQAKLSRRASASPVSEDRIPLAMRVRRDGVPSAEDLVAALRYFDGSVARTASFFGRDRKQVYRWLDKHGLELESLRGVTDRRR